MIISAAAQRVLKVIHLMTISFWIGGCVAIMALMLVSRHAESGSELYGVFRSMNIVAIIVAAYLGGYGSFFTGLAYSICTNRGFVRHKWVILKWGMTIFMILSGFLFMGPAKIKMMEMVRVSGLEAQNTLEYQHCQTVLFILAVTQFIMFLICTILSVYKPWEHDELAERYKYVRPVSHEKRPDSLDPESF